MKLVGVLADNSLTLALSKAQHYQDIVDVFELRLDCLASWDLKTIAEFQAQLSKPLILTLRSAEQGGCFKAEELTRLSLLKDLAGLAPAYLDLEYTVPAEVIDDIHSNHPNITLIGSIHVFDSTPEDLPALLQKLQHKAFGIKKIITTAQSGLDCLRLLQWRQGLKAQAVVAHCMGELGVPSRILGTALGNVFTYAYLPDPPEDWSESSPVAPGLLDIHSLLDTYRIRSLNQDTLFFGIIGSPVSQSLGHLLHNKVFEQRGFNGVYVKLDVRAEELPSFITIMQTLPFKGFSITTPLKEAICPWFDSFLARDAQVQAYNTMHVTDLGLEGCNTDGLGVLRTLEDAINESLAGHTILLLGAGGAARGIAFALAAAEASVIVINRSVARAQKLVEDVQKRYPQVHIEAYGFDNLPKTAVEKSSALVNALAGDAVVPAPLLGTLASNPALYLLDLNCFYPNTALALMADKGWKVIPGLDTYYFEQAYEQLRFWGVLSPNQAFNCNIKLSTPSLLVEEKD